MMEADTWRGIAPDNGVASQRKQTVLILNQNSTLCAANKCDALPSFLQKPLTVRCLQEECDNHLPDGLSSVPDLILVRCSVGEIARELIQSCKEKWTYTSILALFCVRRDGQLEELPSVVTKVDDFLSCPFHESELLLRVRRLLQSKQTTPVGSKNFGTNEPLHFGAPVGESESFVHAIKNILPLAQSDCHGFNLR